MLTHYIHPLIGLLICLCSFLQACTATQVSSTLPIQATLAKAKLPPQPYFLLSLEQTSRAWSQLAQSERDRRCVAEARRQLGRTGLNCKQWVSSMIPAASHGAVTIPRTLPNAAGYYWDYSPHVQSLCGDISIARPGWTVQSQWRLRSGSITPHTFFIEEMRPAECVIIESNWDRAYTVTRRTLSLARFRESAVAYTLHSFK